MSTGTAITALTGAVNGVGDVASNVIPLALLVGGAIFAAFIGWKLVKRFVK